MNNFIWVFKINKYVGIPSHQRCENSPFKTNQSADLPQWIHNLPINNLTNMIYCWINFDYFAIYKRIRYPINAGSLWWWQYISYLQKTVGHWLLSMIIAFLLKFYPWSLLQTEIIMARSLLDIRPRTNQLIEFNVVFDIERPYTTSVHRWPQTKFIAHYNTLILDRRNTINTLAPCWNYTWLRVRRSSADTAWVPINYVTIWSQSAQNATNVFDLQKTHRIDWTIDKPK